MVFKMKEYWFINDIMFIIFNIYIIKLLFRLFCIKIYGYDFNKFLFIIYVMILVVW